MHTDIEGRIDDSSASHRKCAGLISSPGFHGADGLPMHAEQARAARDVTVSIVSHGQNAMVNMLLMDIAARCAERVAVVVTANRQDAMELETALPYPLQVVRNAAPKGFGANHNAAFRFCRTEYFCVANPDIRLQRDPFVPLVETASRRTAGAVGPLVRNLEGEIEDSARRYPTLLSLLGKVLRPKRGPDYEFEGVPLAVDWVAGMFMVFPREAYGAVGGFDESYFLYYEDVDLCRRLHRAGKEVFFDPRSEVYHAAQRSSRRNLRMALHHAVSALRFLLRP
jgi:N-acetylglucosaminyl-diphospho-decaprenol L-rhamnosyltransferase